MKQISFLYFKDVLAYLCKKIKVLRSFWHRRAAEKSLKAAVEQKRLGSIFYHKTRPCSFRRIARS